MRRKSGLLMAGILLLGIWAPNVHSKDLGVHGAVFEIEEENLLEVLQKRLHVAQENGKLEELKKDLIQKTQKSLARPNSINLPKAQKPRRFYYDPSLTLTSDIKDSQGNLVAAKGTRINPLDHLSFGAPLLFLDGDDQAHLTWAKNQEENAKWVLVKGAPFDVMEEEERQVFFDQGGKLIEKFGIRAIPAKVTQKGKHLLVEEVMLEEEKKKENTR